MGKCSSTPLQHLLWITSVEAGETLSMRGFWSKISSLPRGIISATKTITTFLSDKSKMFRKA